MYVGISMGKICMGIVGTLVENSGYPTFLDGQCMGYVWTFATLLEINSVTVI